MFAQGGPMLTARQQEIWNFLVQYVDGHGYPPTVREIGEAVGLASPSTVHSHLANLERAGYLRRDPTKPRALELVGREKAAPEPAAPAAELEQLPLLGQIAAGAPLLAQELAALLRGASLECPVCGEFVLHEGPTIACPECGMRVHGRVDNAGSGLQLDVQAG